MDKTLAPQKTSSPPVTECTQSSFSFARHFSRQVSAQFDGGIGQGPRIKGRGMPRPCVDLSLGPLEYHFQSHLNQPRRRAPLTRPKLRFATAPLGLRNCAWLTATASTARRNNASCDRIPSLRGKPNNVGQMIDKPADTHSMEDLCRQGHTRLEVTTSRKQPRLPAC